MQVVLNYLAEERVISVETPIGIFGTSSGAYFALRAAAMNPRLSTCISIGGYISAAAFLELAPKNREMVATLVGVDDPSTITDPDAFYLPLTQLTQAIDCPLLLVHGGADHLVSLDQFERLQQWAQGKTDTWLLPTSGHVCYDRFEELLPITTDWMANKLGMDTPVPLIPKEAR